MIDRSLLDEASLEFVVVSDTHYMRPPGDQLLELESRRRQTARVEHALRMIASLSTPFVIHLGDLVQAFPGMEEFDLAMEEALAQITTHGLPVRHVAGNHDVGDKPDPTMPTAWVTAGALARYHEAVGPSWYSWDAGGYHFVVLNSQIMNGPLPAADEQQRWCEADLSASAGRPVIISLHLAPYLVDPAEPSLSHYDNIAEPARSWLIDLVERHDVRLLFTGHSHFQFFNRIGDARYYVVPSTSFTRPGFSEIFSSPAPPERGRDDVDKTGFFLVRIQDDGPRVHRIRTLGIEEEPADRAWRHIVTRLSVDLPHSPLGVVARHPIAPVGEVPVAWPSMIRQPVRNDYPLLACVELGARHIRVPASDLSDPVQRQRLSHLRDEGVSVTTVCLWSEDRSPANLAGNHDAPVDAVEVQTPGTLYPEPETLDRLMTATNLPVTLTPLIPNEVVRGKQHARTRLGYRVDELAALDTHLAALDIELDQVAVRVDHVDRPWEVMGRARPLGQVGNFDWLIEMDTLDDREQSTRIAEALFAAALQPGCRLFLDPLADLDRTMDITQGLIDRTSNPRPAYNVARLLNSLLFGEEDSFQQWIECPQWQGMRCLGIASQSSCYCLLIPQSDPPRSLDIAAEIPDRSSTHVYELGKGMCWDVCEGDGDSNATVEVSEHPMLIAFKVNRDAGPN